VFAEVLVIAFRKFGGRGSFHASLKPEVSTGFNTHHVPQDVFPATFLAAPIENTVSL
jgi:hypothetical protein